jgi:hypothetical protein
VDLYFKRRVDMENKIVNQSIEVWRVTLLAKMTNPKLTTADKKWSLLWKKIV